jgi:hypothetical protein
MFGFFWQIVSAALIAAAATLLLTGGVDLWLALGLGAVAAVCVLVGLVFLRPRRSGTLTTGDRHRLEVVADLITEAGALRRDYAAALAMPEVPARPRALGQVRYQVAVWTEIARTKLKAACPDLAGRFEAPRQRDDLDGIADRMQRLGEIGDELRGRRPLSPGRIKAFFRRRRS